MPVELVFGGKSCDFGCVFVQIVFCASAFNSGNDLRKNVGAAVKAQLSRRHSGSEPHSPLAGGVAGVCVCVVAVCCRVLPCVAVCCRVLQ